MMESDRAAELETDRAGPSGSRPSGRVSPCDTNVSAHGRLRTLIPLLLVCGLLCLEAALFVALSADYLDMPVVLSIHLGLCAMTATIGRWWVKAHSAVEDVDDNAMTILQLAAWTTLAGPFGTVVGAMLLVPRRGATVQTDATADAGSNSSAMPVGTDRRHEPTRLELLHSTLLDGRLRIAGAHSVRPLLDVIIEGTQIEKLDALSLISKRFAPALAPALRRALEDGDSSVRVLAATVTAQQHNARTKRIGALQAIARAAPERSSGWGALGQAHLDYAESGLLEASRAEAEASQGRAYMARAEQLDPVTS